MELDNEIVLNIVTRLLYLDSKKYSVFFNYDLNGFNFSVSNSKGELFCDTIGYRTTINDVVYINRQFDEIH